MLGLGIGLGLGLVSPPKLGSGHDQDERLLRPAGQGRVGEKYKSGRGLGEGTGFRLGAGAELIGIELG